MYLHIKVLTLSRADDAYGRQPQIVKVYKLSQFVTLFLVPQAYFLTKMFAIKFSIEWNIFLEVRRWLNTTNIGRKSEHNGIQEKCPPGKVLKS